MATVWCAHDHTLDRRVAIKLLGDAYANDELAGRRFTREARAAARLSGHTNVVTIYDVGRAAPSADVPSGRPFIVMEYLAGGTVADALRTGEFGQPMILRWLREAAQALDFAHHRGVIHRDVKLSNFMLDCARTLHVADFGIAQLTTEDTLSSSGDLLGTAAYLAPERALGLPATESSDRYSLAVAAFELLVGERPFRAGHFAAQARQHVEDPPPRASARNSALPVALDAVLAKGMAKHQEQRFATATELVDEIGRALAPSIATQGAAVVKAAPSLATRRVAGERATAPPVRIYGRRRSRARIAALAAITAAIASVAIVAAATILPRSPERASAHSASALYAQHPVGAQQPLVVHTASDRPRQSTAPRARKASPATTHAASAPSSAAPATAPPSPAAPAASAGLLEAQGHQSMVGGDYLTAIRLLRQAVSSAPRTSLTYAYALFDLGRSLRLAGDPQAAVSVLWQRLQIPNQQGVVRGELTRALEALGQHAGGGGSD